MTMKNTPTPWHITHVGNIATTKGQIVAFLGTEIPNSMGGKSLLNPDERSANAELIVKAVNNYHALESQVKELREAGNALIEAMNQYSFFADGYRNGSASISEVQHANDQQNEAYSKMFDVLKSLNKQP